MEKERGEPLLGKLQIEKRKETSLQTKIPFYFLYRCQLLSWHPIYYSVNQLIRVDTNRAEIRLTCHSQGFFSHFCTKPNFPQRGRKGKEAVGVLFPAFSQQGKLNPPYSRYAKAANLGLKTIPQKWHTWNTNIRHWKGLHYRK